MELRGQLPQNHVAEDFGGVVVVLGGVLDEGETVHVADDRFAVGTEQVEATDHLLESQAHLPGYQLLFV